MENDFITEQKNERELEEAKRKQRKNIKLRAGLACWLVVGIGCFLGGALAGINELVFAAMGVLCGGVLLYSLIIIGSFYVKNAKKNVEKYGGSIKPYIYKGITLITAITAAIAFGVCGAVLSVYYIFGTVAFAFVFIIVIFAWRP